DIECDILLNTDLFLNLQEETFQTDIFLQRSLSYFRGLYINAILESQGYRVINNFKCAQICGNKLLTTLEMIKNKIPTPEAYCAFTKDGALEALEQMGYPAVIKPIVGSWGRLVALLKDRDFAVAVLEDRETLGQLYHKIFYLQEYIWKPARDRNKYVSERGESPRDIRVLIIGDEVVTAMYRYEIKNDWRSTATFGARSKSCKITPEMEEISLKAAEVVDGEILGLDLMESDNQYLIQEINHTSGFKAASWTTGTDIAGRIVDYIIKECKK
ncbi:MAG: RimK family alpha-L-glutamate ligase, partial [Candidatus Lokiarchaeota archaeon]|nr:RimK family alpha-L-glutamate ligase [Candidatus Lokiarchaeota archaeon]